MCKYLAFKGDPNSKVNIYVPCFQREATNRNCNAQVLFFQRGPNSNFNVFCITAVVLQRLLISKAAFMLLIR